MPDDNQELAPRRRGRPPTVDKKSCVTAWLPPAEHDRLVRIANKARIPVSHFVRQLIIVVLGPHG